MACEPCARHRRRLRVRAGVARTRCSVRRPTPPTKRRSRRAPPTARDAASASTRRRASPPACAPRGSSGRCASARTCARTTARSTACASGGSARRAGAPPRRAARSCRRRPTAASPPPSPSARAPTAAAGRGACVTDPATGRARARATRGTSAAILLAGRRAPTGAAGGSASTARAPASIRGGHGRQLLERGRACSARLLGPRRVPPRPLLLRAGLRRRGVRDRAAPHARAEIAPHALAALCAMVFVAATLGGLALDCERPAAARAADPVHPGERRAGALRERRAQARGRRAVRGREGHSGGHSGSLGSGRCAKDRALHSSAGRLTPREAAGFHDQLGVHSSRGVRDQARALRNVASLARSLQATRRDALGGPRGRSHFAASIATLRLRNRRAPQLANGQAGGQEGCNSTRRERRAR